MALSPGTRLGVYEVTAPLGEGGMGQVYRAHDTRLHRDVALKLLSDAFVSDPERLARFSREAQTLASLNHPHIAAIYGIEESNGLRAIVMELVEGEDLSQRIARGPLPLGEALPIAQQIADALEAAHEQGFIHRDLKPANIKVREDGTVKVLDFGLAKAMEVTTGSSPNVSQSPTITTPAMTQAGMILGTAAYMSPEQAKGRAADRRSDIWAFGVVVYELLTGRRAFTGEDVSDTLAFILTREPDWSRLPSGTPTPIRKLLRRCLDKDRKQRLDSATVARLEIEEALAAPTVADAVTGSPGRAPRSALARALRWAAAALLAVVAAGSFWMAWRPSRRVDHPLVRLNVDLGPDALVGPLSTTAELSPDGTRLVFLARGPDGKPQLATRPLDQTTPTLLRGTENARDWFFSPDGAWIGFFADGKLKKIAVQGGAPVTLCDAAATGGGSWGEDGTIIAGLGYASGLFRIPEAGGTPQPLTKIDKGEATHRWPQIISGTAAVLFTASSSVMTSEDSNIDVFSWKTGQRKTLVRGGYFGRYVPTTPTSGHLVYVHDGTMFGVPFDPIRLELAGAPVPVLEDVADNPASGAGFYLSGTPSSGGTLVYRSGKVSGQRWSLVWLDTSGKTQPLLARPGKYDAPRLSPDGQRLAVEVAVGIDHDVYLYDLQRDNTSRLTFTGGEVPIWAPDGKHLAFSLGSAFWWVRADGADEPQRLLEDTEQNGGLVAYSFSPDGGRLAYMSLNAETGWDISVLPLDMSDPEHPKPGKPESFLRTRSDELEPVFSPDGRWIAYRSNESGTWELYVRPSQHASGEPGGKWQVSNGGVQHPSWARASRQLFYESIPDNHIMVADYTVQGSSFVAGKPRVWSPAQIPAPSGKGNLAVAADGQRLAVFARPEIKEDNGSVQVTFLLNFFDELRRRVPLGH